MASSATDVPTWSGDPVEFESFAIACRWYEKSAKDSERKQAASRVWAKLTGPAKAVVRHLNPDDYEAPDGLSRLVQVLRTSPLQQFPVPDLFKRLDTWHHLRRANGESIPQLLVREEDTFVQLQSALLRAREDRGQVVGPTGSTSQPTSPAAAPQTDAGGFSSPVGARAGEAPQARQRPAPEVPQPTGTGVGTTGQSDSLGFFEDELRGYRLLKSARLSPNERQNVDTDQAT